MAHRRWEDWWLLMSVLSLLLPPQIPPLPLPPLPPLPLLLLLLPLLLLPLLLLLLLLLLLWLCLRGWGENWAWLAMRQGGRKTNTTNRENGTSCHARRPPRRQRDGFLSNARLSQPPGGIPTRNEGVGQAAGAHEPALSLMRQAARTRRTPKTPLRTPDRRLPTKRLDGAWSLRRI